MSLPEPSTEICEDRDFVEWHRGHPWCAVWVLRTEHAEVQAQVARVRQQLAPWLLARYARQPHVTLAYRGLMAATPSVCAAEHLPMHVEFGVQQLRADVHALQTAQLPVLTVQLQGAGSFATVPYLGVAASADLLRVHEVLAAQTPALDAYPGWRYVPHVTLGHYACRLPLSTVEATLRRAMPSEARWRMPVQQLWLARYRTDDIAGPLYFEGCFDLRTQRYRAQPGALLAWES